LSVIAEADSGEAACKLYAELSPDVVVMDIAMPGMGGSRPCAAFAPIIPLPVC